uniref:Uncharacterized protein n=1 Tax=Arundo donax TaxID=35708 RepID=A0A0A9GKM8_ARUDO
MYASYCPRQQNTGSTTYCSGLYMEVTGCTKKFKSRLELATSLFHGSSHCMNCTTGSIPWVRSGHCWDDMKCPIALYWKPQEAGKKRKQMVLLSLHCTSQPSLNTSFAIKGMGF